MTSRKLLLALVCLVVAVPLGAQTNNQRESEDDGSRRQQTGQIEPNAGNWRTWVIRSGKDYRVPPPPGAKETKAELRSLAALIAQNDAHTQEQIAFWDAGSPA